MSELEMLFVPFEKLFVTGCVTEILQTKIDLFSKQNQVQLHAVNFKKHPHSHSNRPKIFLE